MWTAGRTDRRGEADNCLLQFFERTKNKGRQIMFIIRRPILLLKPFPPPPFGLLTTCLFNVSFQINSLCNVDW